MAGKSVEAVLGGTAGGRAHGGHRPPPLLVRRAAIAPTDPRPLYRGRFIISATDDGCNEVPPPRDMRAGEMPGGGSSSRPWVRPARGLVRVSVPDPPPGRRCAP